MHRKAGIKRNMNAVAPPATSVVHVHMQRKAEIKRNTKREKREQEKRQALAALNEPTSPRGGLVGRPRKLSALEGLQLGGDGTDGTDGSNWRGGTPGLSTGEVGCGELAALPVGDADLVDPLSTRWVGCPLALGCCVWRGGCSGVWR